MALSQELQQKLTALKASIEQFMELHKNPHDTSKYNELAKKMQKIDAYLAANNIGESKTDNAPLTTKTLQGSVGKGGTNNQADVQLVQELLNKLGADVDVDGKMGNQTIATIKNYQQSIGNNNPDGLIEPGKNTWKALASGKGNAGGPGAVQPGEKRGIKAVATRYGYIDDPYANQNDLNAIGNNNNKLTQGKSVALSPELYDLLGIGYKSGAYINVEFPNGSVKKFQTADQTRRGLKGLRVDFFDPKGQFKSVDGKTLYVTKVSSSGSVDVVPPNGGGSASTDGLSDSVGKGGANKEADVKKVQELLNKKGNNLTVDGKYGNNTLQAIIAFQQSIGNNNPDGLIEPGKNTWKALNSGGGNSSTGGGNSQLTTLKAEVEQARTGAREALSTVKDLNAAQISIEAAEKAKVEAYVAKAKAFLDAYEAASTTDKAAFDKANQGYAAEIKQSYEWNINSFLPKTQGGNANNNAGGVTISASVGQGGENKPADVKKIQALLNKKGGKLEVDGKIGDKTIAAIRSFQRSVSIGADGLVSPDKNTLKELNGTKGKVTEDKAPSGGYAPPSGSYKYYNHSNWQNVRATLQPGSRTAKKLNATAERLLRSIVAGAGVSSTIITSTKRNYTDQAYILLTQVTRAEAYKWYGHVNTYSAQFEKYRRQLRSGKDRETVFREYGEFIRRNVGLAASNHLSGIAIDISGPNYKKVERFAKTLVPVSGSGVKRVFPEAGRSHIEFTFQVT